MVARAEECRSQRLGARDQLLSLEAYKRGLGARLDATPNGPDSEQCWELLTLLEPQIREQEQTYLELADIAPKPEERGTDEKGTRAHAASA